MRTKRVCDFFLSVLGLIVLFPLFIPIAILIKLDSKGPVFYKGVRLGRFGRPFIVDPENKFTFSEIYVIVYDYGIFNRFTQKRP